MPVKLFAVFTGLLLSMPSAQAKPSLECAPMAGAEAIASRADLDFLVFGEAHGTAELPALFGDLVCAVAATGRPVVVGVEFLPANQSRLETFLATRDADSARKTLLSAPAWSDRVGRASVAMLAMLEQVRSLHAAGAEVRLVAFDHESESGPTSEKREAGMGQRLLDASRAHAGALVIALTGVGHADRTGWQSFKPPFRSAVQYLPDDRTLSLTFVRGGGEAWACRPPAEGAPEECKVWPGTKREEIPGRGIVLDASRPGFDGVVSAGKPYSAAPPARNP
jgi:hypothetical protein